MSDIGLSYGMNANTHVENEHVNAAATGASDGAIHANGADASYEGGADGGLSYDVAAPDLPDMPAAVTDAKATIDPVVGDATAQADGALGAVGGAPELPALDEGLDGAVEGAASASADGSSIDVAAMLEGWLDIMGDVVAQFSGSLTALLGF